jgi:hypothetical protein
MLMASKYASKGAGWCLHSSFERAYPASARAEYARISRSSSMSNFLPETLSQSAISSSSCAVT